MIVVYDDCYRHWAARTRRIDSGGCKCWVLPSLRTPARLSTRTGIARKWRLSTTTDLISLTSCTSRWVTLSTSCARAKVSSHVRCTNHYLFACTVFPSLNFTWECSPKSVNLTQWCPTYQMTRFRQPLTFHDTPVITHMRSLPYSLAFRGKRLHSDLKIPKIYINQFRVLSDIA